MAIGADAANYLGYAFFVRPVSRTDDRSADAAPAQEHWFWSVAKRFWENYSHVAIAALVVNLLALATPIFTMNVYDRVVPNGAIPSLVALAIGMVIAIVFDFVLRMVRGRIVDVTGKKIDVVLAAKIFEHVQSVKLGSRPASVGVLANQLRDFDSVREFFTSGSVVAITDLLFAFVFIAVLFIVAGPLAWIPIVILPVMIALGFLVQRPLQAAMKRLQGESAARHGVLVESLNSLETVRAVGAEARMQSRWERSVAATARSSEDVQFWASIGTQRSQHRAAGRNAADDDHRCVPDPRRQAVGRRAGCGIDACRTRSGADHRRGSDDHPRKPDRHVTSRDRRHHAARTRTSAGPDVYRPPDRARHHCV